ncbi:hypothetical protein ABT095_02565 [Kitasatospora sp. NPDC002227]
MTQKSDSQPAVELRIGGVHLTIQRIPAWLITTATAGGSTVVALLSRR